MGPTQRKGQMDFWKNLVSREPFHGGICVLADAPQW
jgi:hypothetical protein